MILRDAASNWFTVVSSIFPSSLSVFRHIDLSGDTNARYHAMIPSIPRAATDESNAAFAGGAAAETPSTAYGEEASDRYLSHRERMITATRERMGDGKSWFGFGS